MFESKAECIANCMQCVPGTYPLARGFGLGGLDEPAQMPRLGVQVQMATYYPGTTIAHMTFAGMSNGQFNSKLELKGGA